MKCVVYTVAATLATYLVTSLTTYNSTVAILSIKPLKMIIVDYGQ